MKQKLTSADKHIAAVPPARVVLITLDSHVGTAFRRAKARLQQSLPALSLAVHAASDWDTHPDKLDKCKEDIARADLIIANMLFMEPHINAVLPALAARRDSCDALVCCMSAPEVMKLTRMGRFTMSGEASGPMALLKRMRGKSDNKGSAGAQQLSVLRRLPRILRFIPGTAQDVRAYFLTLQYWLAGSDINLENMVRLLLKRYSSGEREVLKTILEEPKAPVEYPDVGLYHPELKERITVDLGRLPSATRRATTGTVGVLLMRSYALADNSDHYDQVIAALESQGLRVIPAFASGLDARPAVQHFFIKDNKPCVDAVVSLTGFSLVGGPAYNDATAAAELLGSLNVPYLAVQALEFQSLHEWQESNLGLTPIESTMMVSIPELDGATGSMVFGGRKGARGSDHEAMEGHPERISMLANRVAKLIELRRSERRHRKVAIVLFNFPPNGGSVGTAAHLSVFESLHNTLTAMAEQGYSVDVPKTADLLRDQLLTANASQFGMDASVCAKISVDDYVAREPWLEEIEAQWGAAPGKHLTNGREIYVLGVELGNVLIAVQPSMGYEGDPMRLLFEGGHAPTHAFSAFYRYLREDWQANAVLHFGTHGALEFMPGKQVGLSENCWPDRLIGALPNFYLYAANNPSEGLIAKRRSAATLISYLTPSVASADLYRELQDLKDAIDRWRVRDLDASQRANLSALIHTLATESDLISTTTELWAEDQVENEIEALRLALLEIEESLIPYGLHVVGKAPSLAQKIDLLRSVAHASFDVQLSDDVLAAVINDNGMAELGSSDSFKGLTTDQRTALSDLLTSTLSALDEGNEIKAILNALDGAFIAPVAGGDLLKNPEMLPTGRNIHGFDPFRLPSQFAMNEGARQADQLLARHLEDTGELPTSVALVLWGTDNLKSEGVAIAQALALIGARPRIDSYGRVTGAELIDLKTLGRSRIDVVMTLSGIFRDLLPLQIRLLAEAAYLAAAADEPLEKNPIRANTLSAQASENLDFDTAALRVFSNAEGTYGSNVNMLIDSGAWEEEAELATTFTARKGHAYTKSGAVTANPTLLSGLLQRVDLAYQNLDSVEMGVTTVDHYFDTLGGISRAIQSGGERDVPVYIADHTGGAERVRTLSEQVALETRTRALNPKWYESMLDHGYEGVRAIESHVTNTMGWSATTGKVAPWVYQQLSETFILDDAMRQRLAKLNPAAASKVANRLLEASERQYWQPDDACLEALQRAGEDLEDWVEGINTEAAV